MHTGFGVLSSWTYFVSLGNFVCANVKELDISSAGES